MISNQIIQNQTFCHQEHQQWLSQLNFYQDEIKFFQNKLSFLLLNRNDSLSIIEHVYEYRDIFLKKLNRIDELRHQIIMHEKKLSQTLEVK